MKDRFRLSMDISRDTKRTMEKLVKATQSGSLVEFLRRAVALYDLVNEHERQKGQLVFRHADGREEVLKLL